MSETTEPLDLVLRTRIRDTDKPEFDTLAVPPDQLGIVLVDLWNYHWCKTSSERVACLVPRVNACLEIARSIGIQVFLCPTDVADSYAGTVQYERPLAAERYDVPDLPDPAFPTPPDGGGCPCGTDEDGRCQTNYGWDAMSPDLTVGDEDLIVDDRQLLYSLCRVKGITHLIYAGVHTQMCLLGKSIGMLAMLKAGMTCTLARDLTDAHGRYDPAVGLTPDDFTDSVVNYFERYLCPTINLADTLREAGLWTGKEPVDPVRIAPWGTVNRPHFFEDPITVTLTTPWQPEATIRFTSDGSDVGSDALEYLEPLTITRSTLLRAAAYLGSDRVTIPSQGYFAHLSDLPPAPDVHLSDLDPVQTSGSGHRYGTEIRWTPGTNSPQKDSNNRRQTLRLRNNTYEKGIGVHATNAMTFELKPEYESFVGLAGVDDNIVDQHLASNLAMHPSVVFRVVLDGEIAAESTVMRIQEKPWRFHVQIPKGSRYLRLVASDGGSGHSENLANWVNAGFTVR